MRDRFIRCCILLAALAAVTPVSAAPQKLNVVFILADDLGWTDLGCFGSDLYQTPRIDRLAAEGMKFTAAYSACTVCSPTRAAVMTGKYPARLHVTDWIPGRMPGNPKLLVPDWTKQLPLEETTIAEAVKPAGYFSGSIGKWHLGDEPYWPTHQGFDVNVAGTDLGSPRNSYFSPYKIATLPDGPEGEYLTDRMGDEAAKFIRAHKNQPFLLYLPHFAVHTPIQSKKDVTARFTEAAAQPGRRHTNAVYAGMIASMDEAVGRVLDTLREQGIDDRTLVIFTSDNGGHLPTTTNTPLRVGKGSAYEGGVRVPLIVRWPGVTKPGSVSDVPVMSIDYYPTILDALGLPDIPGHTSDGVSLVPIFRGAVTMDERPIFWHYPHHQLYQRGGTTPYGAVRRGDFRLVEFYDDMHVELYNLREDVGEQHDLTASMPDKAAALRDELHAWRAAVNAQMPTPNPKYDPAKPQHVDAKPKKAAKK